MALVVPGLPGRYPPKTAASPAHRANGPLIFPGLAYSTIPHVMDLAWDVQPNTTKKIVEYGGGNSIQFTVFWVASQLVSFDLLPSQ